MDLGGRRVATLFDGVAPAGASLAHWDGHDAAGAAVSPGVYFVRLASGAVTRTRRVTVLR